MKLTKNPIIMGGDQNLKSTAQTIENSAVKGGAAYPAYQVAIERAHNQVSSKGFDVTKASASDRLLHELHLDAAACHLIEDWKGVALKENGKVIEAPYSAENAMKLFNLGDICPQIWAFVKTQSELIQFEADKHRDETLGKS